MPRWNVRGSVPVVNPFAFLRTLISQLARRLRSIPKVGLRTALASPNSDLRVVQAVLADWRPARGPLLLVLGHRDSDWLKKFGRAGASPIAVIADPWEPTATTRALLAHPPYGAVLDVAGGDEHACVQRLLAIVAASAEGTRVRLLVDGLASSTAALPERLRRATQAKGNSPIVRSSALAIGEDVVVTRRTVNVTVRTAHYLGIGERDAEVRLADRAPHLALTSIARLPGTTVTARARLFHHNRRNSDSAQFEKVMRAPTMHVREYSGRLHWYSHMLLVHEQTLLPPSFRFPHSKFLDNPLARHLGDDVYSLKVSEGVSAQVDEVLYDLSGGWPSHFGHFISQGVAKLWGWEDAKAQYPELKAAVQVADRSEHSFEEALLTAYGIDSNDILWIDRPIRAQRIISASLLYQAMAPSFVHPRLHETWDRISTGLVKSDLQKHSRLFVSRTSEYSLRTCRNQKEVEDLFRAAGFTVYYPELHSVSEQAAAFSTAEVIAGFGGSAMFNLMHARSLKVLIVLSHESYAAMNEYLLAADRDCEIHYFWSEADIPPPENGVSEAAFQSTWEFDFKHNSRDLAELLGAI